MKKTYIITYHCFEPLNSTTHSTSKAKVKTLSIATSSALLVTKWNSGAKNIPVLGETLGITAVDNQLDSPAPTPAVIVVQNSGLVSLIVQTFYIQLGSAEIV